MKVFSVYSVVSSLYTMSNGSDAPRFQDIPRYVKISQEAKMLNGRQDASSSFLCNDNEYY